jgi:hypothetical protein
MPARPGAAGARAPRHNHCRDDGRNDDGHGGDHHRSDHTTTPALPDLVVSDLQAFSATVANQGMGAAGASVLRIAGVGDFKIGALAAGASQTVTWKTCVPPCRQPRTFSFRSTSPTRATTAASSTRFAEASLAGCACRAGQLLLTQNGIEIASTVYGRATGTSEISGQAILTVAAGDVLTLRESIRERHGTHLHADCGRDTSRCRRLDRHRAAGLARTTSRRCGPFAAPIHPPDHPG